MESMPAAAAIAVTVGVDTHLDQHVAAVIDQAGRLCSTKAFAGLHARLCRPGHLG